MKKITWSVVLLICCLAVAGVAAAETDPADQDYRIGPGDVIDISVWKDEVMNKRVVVLPDGKISFPLIGILTAAGRTPAQLQKTLEKRVARYMPNPVVSVVVQQVNSLLVYVIGKVNSPGRFLLNSDIDVLQALALAGGLNPFAKGNQIKVLRKKGTETKILPFSYDKVSTGKRLEQNIMLQRGDVVVVP